MKIKHITTISGGQDGAIWGDYLFRFDSRGNCNVYDISSIPDNPDKELSPLSAFRLDKADVIAPHSNTVMFGNEYYSSDDKYPLLYSNIYNNYANSHNPLKGVCCVYRLKQNGQYFSTTLVQLIEIGFVDSEYWSSATMKDVRPYGNFTIDCEKSVYYAFTMHDESKTARYFAFKLPRSSTAHSTGDTTPTG